MYSYLATLRLHATSEAGATLTVGPKRRVVFRERIVYPKGGLRKDEIKRILRPLKPYWGLEEPTKHLERVRDPDRPLMTFLQFKLAAKQLLKDAGMLLDKPTED
jgi:hypothetical protein